MANGIVGIEERNRRAEEELLTGVNPVSQLFGTQKGRDQIIQQGLVPAGAFAVGRGASNLGRNIAGTAETALGPAARFLFTGQGVPDALGQPNEDPQAMLAALGLPDPLAQGREPDPAAALGGFGSGGQLGLSQRTGVNLGPAFSAPDPLQLGRASAPDFSGIREALGPPPEAPEEASLGEKLARVLGQAGAGAAQGLASGLTGQGAVGAVLGLAGGGAAQATTAISREEANRQSEFQDRMDTHNRNLASLEQRATEARSQTDMFNIRQAAAEAENAQNLAIMEAKARAPTITSGSAGSVIYTRVDENGDLISLVDDPYAWLKEMQTKAAAGKGTKILTDTGEIVDRSALSPSTLQTLDIVNEFMRRAGLEDPDIREEVDELAQAQTGMTLEEINFGAAQGSITQQSANVSRFRIAQELLIRKGFLQAPTVGSGL